MSNKTVSLVLGSGGARGLCHIGVIDWLTENGFEIASISGSSMGALVGGIYAAGKLEVYSRWVQALERHDVIRLLDPTFGRTALFKGERIIDVLRDLIGDFNIEELPITFTAVATDVYEEKEVWLSKGSLFDAIRASIAIPTVFSPFNYHGRKLVDGGLVNPIPIAPTQRDLTDLTIAVNLSAAADESLEPPKTYKSEEPENRYHKAISEFIENLLDDALGRDEGDMDLFDVISQSLDTMQNTIARFKLAAYNPDIIVDIPKNACSFYEFYRAKEMIAIGRQRAEAVLAGKAD